jgi:hypothetical protein
MQAGRHFCQDTESNQMTIGTIRDRPIAADCLPIAGCHRKTNIFLFERTSDLQKYCISRPTSRINTLRQTTQM